MGTYKKDGSQKFRNVCERCHKKRQAQKKGLTITQLSNEFHVYKKYRKVYRIQTSVL